MPVFSHRFGVPDGDFETIRGLIADDDVTDFINTAEHRAASGFARTDSTEQASAKLCTTPPWAFDKVELETDVDYMRVSLRLDGDFDAATTESDLAAIRDALSRMFSDIFGPMLHPSCINDYHRYRKLWSSMCPQCHGDRCRLGGPINDGGRCRREHSPMMVLTGIDDVCVVLHFSTDAQVVDFQQELVSSLRQNTARETFRVCASNPHSDNQGVPGVLLADDSKSVGSHLFFDKVFEIYKTFPSYRVSLFGFGMELHWSQFYGLFDDVLQSRWVDHAFYPPGFQFACNVTPVGLERSAACGLFAIRRVDSEDFTFPMFGNLCPNGEGWIGTAVNEVGKTSCVYGSMLRHTWIKSKMKREPPSRHADGSSKFDAITRILDIFNELYDEDADETLPGFAMAMRARVEVFAEPSASDLESFDHFRKFISSMFGSPEAVAETVHMIFGNVSVVYVPRPAWLALVGDEFEKIQRCVRRSGQELTSREKQSWVRLFAIAGHSPPMSGTYLRSMLQQTTDAAIIDDVPHAAVIEAGRQLGTYVQHYRENGLELPRSITLVFGPDWPQTHSRPAGRWMMRSSRHIFLLRQPLLAHRRSIPPRFGNDPMTWWKRFSMLKEMHTGFSRVTLEGKNDVEVERWSVKGVSQALGFDPVPVFMPTTFLAAAVVFAHSDQDRSRTRWHASSRFSMAFLQGHGHDQDCPEGVALGTRVHISQSQTERLPSMFCIDSNLNDVDVLAPAPLQPPPSRDRSSRAASGRFARHEQASGAGASGNAIDSDDIGGGDIGLMDGDDTSQHSTQPVVQAQKLADSRAQLEALLSHRPDPLDECLQLLSLRTPGAGFQGNLGTRHADKTHHSKHQQRQGGMFSP